ncbi:MAG TPA: hypothetical protein VEZ40_08000 [Pyrinomonadaceae bacterium]|nr:hypothetical protein [Pyrinomonadaceae bacterium]
MAIRKLNTKRTDVRLLLEADEAVELPPAEIEEGAIVVQFDNVRPFIPELLETLRAGTLAELVPVMLDGSTFAIHTRTRTFWVKLWHAAGGDLSRIERAQVISCLPSTRGLQVIVGDEDEDDDYDEEELDDVEFEEDDEDDDEDDAVPVNQQPES